MKFCNKAKTVDSVFTHSQQGIIAEYTVTIGTLALYKWALCPVQTTSYCTKCEKPLNKGQCAKMPTLYHMIMLIWH